MTQLTVSNFVSCCLICFLLIRTGPGRAELKQKQTERERKKMQQMFNDRSLAFRFGWHQWQFQVSMPKIYCILHTLRNVLHFLSLKCVASNYANNLLLSTPHICLYLFFCWYFHFYLELFIFSLHSYSFVIQPPPKHFVKPNVITCQ